jgi:hypothetical protein
MTRRSHRSKPLGVQSALRVVHIEQPQPRSLCVPCDTLLVLDSSRTGTIGQPPYRAPLELRLVVDDDPYGIEDDDAKCRGSGVVGVMDLAADETVVQRFGNGLLLRSEYGIELPSAPQREIARGTWEGDGALVLGRWRYLEWQLCGDTWKLRVALPVGQMRSNYGLRSLCYIDYPICCGDVTVGKVEMKFAEHAVLRAPNSADIQTIEVKLPPVPWLSGLDDESLRAYASQLDGIRTALTIDVEGETRVSVVVKGSGRSFRWIDGQLKGGAAEETLPSDHFYLEWRFAFAAKTQSLCMNRWELVRCCAAARP